MSLELGLPFALLRLSVSQLFVELIFEFLDQIVDPLQRLFECLSVLYVRVQAVALLDCLFDILRGQPVFLQARFKTGDRVFGRGCDFVKSFVQQWRNR